MNIILSSVYKEYYYPVKHIEIHTISPHIKNEYIQERYKDIVEDYVIYEIYLHEDLPEGDYELIREYFNDNNNTEVTIKFDDNREIIIHLNRLVKISRSKRSEVSKLSFMKFKFKEEI